MRLTTNLLLSLALVAAIFGAVTAYLPSLGLPDGQLIGLTLNAPAGRRTGPHGREQPFADKNTRLTAPLIAALRSQGVRRVRVKEFAPSRWSGSWLFLAGCLGLAAATWMGRIVNRRALQVHHRAAVERGETPDAILAALRASVDALRTGWPALPDASARLRRTLDVLGDAQDNRVPAFVSNRPALTGRLGLAGYARLMDRFAAGERQINRAWCAAADGMEAETFDCLERASLHLSDAAHCLERPETANPR